MTNRIGAFDIMIWLALIVGRLILCLCVFKKGVRSRLPFFTTYVLASCAESIILIAVAFLGSYTAYFYTFFAASHLVSILAFVTLIEFTRQVLPSLDLPRRWQALNRLLAVLAAIGVFAYLWPMRPVEKRVEVAGYLALAAAFICVTLYSRSLGLRWSRLLSGVSCTLGVLYFTQGIAKALIGHYPPASIVLIRQLSQFANVVAAISWIIVVLRPWGEYDLNDEEVRTLEWSMGRIEENFRRLFSQGVR